MDFEPFEGDDADYYPFSIGDDALNEWHSQVRARVPWNRMPLDDVTGELRPLLAELLTGCAVLDEDGRPRRLHLAARAHGVFRRRQACPPQVLTEELHALGVAITKALSRSGIPPEATNDLRIVLRQDLRTAGRAAAAGYLDWRAPDRRV